MGIPRLLPLIKRNPSLFETYNLKNSSLVIDGSSLEQCLYNFVNINKDCGGDYDAYATKVERFFNVLHKLQIDPFIVFDGGHTKEDREVANMIKRAQLRIDDPMKFAPLLIHETLVSVINKMKIKHVTCDFEAGHEMVVLANKLNCPLLSSNDDFYVFKLFGGFISIFDIKLGTITSDAEITNFEVKIFYIRNLIAKFPYLEGKLPLLAAALRHDYLLNESDAFEKFYRELRLPKPDRDIFEVDDGHFCVLLRTVLYWLESCRNLGTGKNHLMKYTSPPERTALEAFMSKFKNSLNYASFDLGEFVRCSVHDEGSACKPVQETSTWIVHNHRLGILPNFVKNTVHNQLNVLLCQVEDMKSESSHACSKPIREVIYGILLENQEKVQEFDRLGHKPVENIVNGPTESMAIQDIIPNRDNVIKINVEQRLEVLRKAMTASVLGENVAAFHKSAVLYMMVLVFWLKSSKEEIDSGLTSSLVLCFVILSTLQDEASGPDVRVGINNIQKSIVKPPSLPITTLCHPLAQFQSCLKYCIHLNKLLNLPVEDINPALVFSGSLIHKIFHTVQVHGNGWIPTQLKPSPALSGFYVDAMDYIRHNM